MGGIFLRSATFAYACRVLDIRAWYPSTNDEQMALAWLLLLYGLDEQAAILWSTINIFSSTQDKPKGKFGQPIQPTQRCCTAYLQSTGHSEGYRFGGDQAVTRKRFTKGSDET